MLELFLLCVVVLCLGGTAAFLASRWPSLSSLLGAGSVVLASILGVIPAIGSLTDHQASRINFAWNVPYGAFAVGIDALSAVFLIPLFVLAALASVYAIHYLRDMREGKSLGAPWLFFNLLVACIALVFTARNGILFLMAWEGMAITSFFLVTLEHKRKEVRDAGWTYLTVAHLGTAFLLAAFGLMLNQVGSLDFDALPALAAVGPASALFLLILIGFGAKAGLVPLHIWLPEAHPVAPSHVSALMSGVLIKTGIYGILRMLTFFGPPPAWWGPFLVGVGICTGIFGVLFALAQKDLKKLLAYSSVENIGIIMIGIGLGLWGQSQGLVLVSLLGFSVALFHMINHAVFKGLLFLAAGSVLHSTGTSGIGRLGGLAKVMPITSALFALGAAAIVGLPPLNGFASEFLLLSGALHGTTSGSDTAIVPIMAFVGMSAISGLAAAVFAKAFGLTFLGAPRSEGAHHAHEVSRLMLAPLLILATLAVVIGLTAPLLLGLILPAAAQMANVPLATAQEAMMPTTVVLWSVVQVSLLLVGLVALLAFARRRLLAKREVGAAVTWDCGYERPSARMQYTSSSFAQPLVDVFAFVVRPRRYVTALATYFPGRATFSEDIADFFTGSVYSPALGWIEWASARLRMLQRGGVHLYILYIFVTLVALLVWGLGFQR